MGQFAQQGDGRSAEGGSVPPSVNTLIVAGACDGGDTSDETLGVEVRRGT